MEIIVDRMVKETRRKRGKKEEGKEKVENEESSEQKEWGISGSA